MDYGARIQEGASENVIAVGSTNRGQVGFGVVSGTTFV
jgi:hypothetical protein